jgi:hypothetical protein
MECISRLPYSVSSCSGNGYTCSIPNVGCICNSGWTSLGDLSFGISGPDCLINHKAVRILSYICIFIPSISNILIIWHYISLAVRKKSCYVISREYKTLFPLCHLIMGCASSIYGALKVSSPNGKQLLVGRDVSISLVSALFLTFGWFGMVVYLHLIIQFLESYSLVMVSESKERILQRFHKLDTYSWFLVPFALVFSILPVIAVAYPSQSRQLCIACFIGLSMVAFIFGLIFSSCLSFLIKELNVYINSIEEYLSVGIKLVVKRLNAAYFVVVGSCLVLGILLLIFGSSNYLFHLSTYFMLIACICVSPFTLVLVITISRVSSSDYQLTRVIPSDYQLTRVSPSEYQLTRVSPSENQLTHVSPSDYQLTQVVPSHFTDEKTQEQ